MDSDTPASTWMSHPYRRPVVTLTFDLQNLTRSSAGDSGNKYSLQVSRLLKPFMRYRGNKICPEEQTNKCSGQTAQKQCRYRYDQVVKA